MQAPLNDRHYLDHASTSLLRPEAAQAMSSWLGGRSAGDPGRVHAEGHAARDTIERAREAVALLLGTTANRVVFTSGGTEAANAAIFAAGQARSGAPMICADIEHSCVREAARRHGAVLLLEVDPTGRIDLDHLQALLDAGELPVVQPRGRDTAAGGRGRGVLSICGRARAPRRCRSGWSRPR